MELPIKLGVTMPDINLYQMIAESHIEQFEKSADSVAKLEAEIARLLSRCSDRKNPPLEYYEIHITLNPLQEQLRECCAVGAVFTLLYFEAFIYDYAAQYLNDKYLTENYPRLDFLSKWAFIPKLITGYELTDLHPGYKALIEVFEEKNYLANVKKNEVHLGKNIIPKDLKAREVNIYKMMHNCRIALDELPNEINSLGKTTPAKKAG